MITVGAHKKNTAPIGAYVNLELLNYVDKLVETRGFLCRSDGIRSIISEHQQLFSTEIGRNKALTPFKNHVNGNGQTYLHKKQKCSKNTL